MEFRKRGLDDLGSEGGVPRGVQALAPPGLGLGGEAAPALGHSDRGYPERPGVTVHWHKNNKIANKAVGWWQTMFEQRFLFCQDLFYTHRAVCASQRRMYMGHPGRGAWQRRPPPPRNGTIRQEIQGKQVQREHISVKCKYNRSSSQNSTRKEKYGARRRRCRRRRQQRGRKKTNSKRETRQGSGPYLRMSCVPPKNAEEERMGCLLVNRLS